MLNNSTINDFMHFYPSQPHFYSCQKYGATLTKVNPATVQYAVARVYWVVARWLLSGPSQYDIFWSVLCNSIESLPAPTFYVVTYKIVIKSRDVMFSYI